MKRETDTYLTMAASKRVGSNCQILAINRIAKPRFCPPFYASPSCLGNCINPILGLCLYPQSHSCAKKGCPLMISFEWLSI